MGAVRATFDVLRVRNISPELAAHLSTDSVKRVITRESGKWMRRIKRICLDDFWYVMLFYRQTPHADMYYRDTTMSYMLQNIACESPIVHDISRVLWAISILPCKNETVKDSFNCFLMSFPRPQFITRKTQPEKNEWAFTVAAPAIANTSFAIGWDRVLRKIVREFADGITSQMPESPLRGILLHFLECIVTKLDEALAMEQQFYLNVSLALTSAGLDPNLIRMVVPHIVRDGGVPLLQMPRYLYAPKSSFMGSY
jgi:hypothetical protein